MDVDHTSDSAEFIVPSVDDRNSNLMHLAEDKNAKRRQVYNRESVRIEDFLTKNPDDINAKQMRVLLPAMFQKLNYPEKDVTRTKIKGLWDESKKPGDFPVDVPFCDPNNAKKMPLEKMKKMFVYLQNKLLEDGYQSASTPEKAKFQVLGENDDIKQPVDVWQLNQQHTQMDAVEEMSEDGSMLPLPQTEVCDLLSTSFSLSAENTEQAICEENNISECQKFVQNTLATLNQPAAEFQRIFQDNSPVTEAMNTVVKDVLGPLSLAANAGDKSKCLELSKSSIALLGIMQRYSFLGPQFDPRAEISSILEEYYNRVVPEDKIPPVDHEVQINNVMANQLSFTGHSEQPHLPTLGKFKLHVLEEPLDIGTQPDVGSIMEEQDIALLHHAFTEQNALQPAAEPQEIDAVRDLGIGITSHFENDADNLGESSSVPYAFQPDFEIMAVQQSTGSHPPTDEEQQEITKTIIEMEADYSTNQGQSIQALVPSILLPDIAREHIITRSFDTKITPDTSQVMTSNIPLIVAEVAEMQDEDPSYKKRRRKGVNKGVTSKSLRIAGKKQIRHRHSKQAK